MVVKALPTAQGKLYSSTLFYAHKESLVYGFEVSHPHIMCSSSKREWKNTTKCCKKNSEEIRSPFSSFLELERKSCEVDFVPWSSSDYANL